MRCGRFFSLLIIILTLAFPFAGLQAETSPNDLGTLLKLLEARNYRWIGIQSNVIFSFIAPGGSQAICGGELRYQRLDEKMLLVCSDQKGDLLFIFRTLDRRFDLYLPSQQTLYHGSIFDLQDSPEIESHLKLLDLYRALKPMTFNPRNAEIDNLTGATIILNIFSENAEPRYLTRKLYMTPQGDVIGEVYFSKEGKPVTEIRRQEILEIPTHHTAFPSIFFPKRVTLVSPETGKNTAILFSKVKSVDVIEDVDWLFPVPEGTREVFLQEKDPRFSDQTKTSALPEAVLK